MVIRKTYFFEKREQFSYKEWEIVSPPFEKPNLKILGNYERKIGGKPGLFGAIVADRRLFLGKIVHLLKIMIDVFR